MVGVGLAKKEGNTPINSRRSYGDQVEAPLIRGESADTHAGDDSNGTGEGDTADDDTQVLC